MNEGLEHRSAPKGHDFDPSVLGEIIARRWKQDRPYFTLIQPARGVWLEAAWSRQSGRSALELHWSRRGPGIARADLLPPPQAVFGGAV
jgi:hypothetical protein